MPAAQLRNLRAASSNNGRGSRRVGGLREGNQPYKKPETKLEKFRRLAKQRVGNAVQAMSLIHQLGNREQYEVRDADVAKIEATLREAVDDVVHALLHNRKVPDPIIFDDEI